MPGGDHFIPTNPTLPMNTESNKISATVAAVIAARDYVASMESVSRAYSPRLAAARAALTKRSIEAVVAGESVAISKIIVNCDESNRLYVALKKNGLMDKYRTALQS